MWPDTSEGRMLIIKGRQAELRAEAAAARMARGFKPGRGYSGLRIRVGSLIIVVGRTFGEDKPSPRLVRF
jgi:hypothetical protein